MQRRSLLIAAGLLSVSGLVFSEPIVDDKSDPYEFVVELSNSVLRAIQSDKELNNGREDKVRKLVDEKIMPFVDFTAVTRIVVGPKWRQASAQEKEELKTEFQNLLLRVYSGALTTITDHSCRLKPTRKRAVADEMVVRTELISSGAAPIGLDYRIYRSKSGSWKVVDVNVEGIWMVENYRTQFAGVLSNGGIPALLKAMREKKAE